jgi:hypothetical protein
MLYSIVNITTMSSQQNKDFQKRINVLDIKCRELWQDYEVDVYLIIHRNGRFHTYVSCTG